MLIERAPSAAVTAAQRHPLEGAARLLQVPGSGSDLMRGPEKDEVVVLKHNFDRLSVLSVTAEVSVDEDTGFYDLFSDSEEQERAMEQGKGEGEGDEGDEKKRADRLRARPTIGPRRGSSQRSSQPRYTEAAGEARLAWRWVEGWRARLRTGGDVVETARWEWRVDCRVGVKSGVEVPVVVVGETGVVGVQG